MEIDRSQLPLFFSDYLTYLDVIRGKAKRTVNEYYHDNELFLRWLHCTMQKKPVSECADVVLAEITVSELEQVTVSVLYDYIRYLRDVRENTPRSVSRRLSAVRSLFKYLTKTKGMLANDPCQNLELPTVKKALPRFLTLEESQRMLQSAEEAPSHDTLRDYCIVTLFLNCGFRLAELVGMNVGDVDFYNRQVRVLGKGSKERIVYLNDACLAALHDYIHARENPPEEPNALFLSRNHRRISRRRVQQIVENTLAAAGLAGRGLSTHKLRHTAATLMYQHGHVDTLTLKEILGHQSIATTEIYTHLSSEQRQNAIDSNPLAGERRHEPKHGT
ncbi:MAG: tyrosine-type recombinase/integrase [Oscillospiraceae bacterium]|nr:tyrosine-type recombinase/integrase [Oscillospiraceae bacterium]